MNKTSSVTVGVVAVTAAILGTTPTVSATPPAAAAAIITVADQPTPGDGTQVNGTRSARQKPVDTSSGNVFTPPVTAPQPTVEPYND